MEVLFLLEFGINSDGKFILKYNYRLYFIGLVFVFNCILEEMSNLATNWQLYVSTITFNQIITE